MNTKYPIKEVNSFKRVIQNNMLITITVKNNAGKVKTVSVFTTVKTTEQNKNNTKRKYVHIWNGNIRSKACLSGIPQRNTVI